MNIALVAHDSKKILMENLCVAYRHILNEHNVYATGTTGRIVEEAMGANVVKYLEGRLGGEQQLAIQIAHNDIDLVVFLCDPNLDHMGEPGISGIMRLCDTHNIPLATNLATAEALLLSLERGDLNWREIVK
ncbi:MAG: methylglyoxal synthase [Defluviitaleaceae bacterium]|nr:methylglyoxal synthase [Defluviitaleaceae bacterium]